MKIGVQILLACRQSRRGWRGILNAAVIEMGLWFEVEMVVERGCSGNQKCLKKIGRFSKLSIFGTKRSAISESYDGNCDISLCKSEISQFQRELGKAG